MSPLIPIQISCGSLVMQNLLEVDGCITVEEFIPMVDPDYPELIEYIQNEVELVIPISSKDRVTSLVLLGGRIDPEPIGKLEKKFLLK